MKTKTVANAAKRFSSVAFLLVVATIISLFPTQPAVFTEGRVMLAFDEPLPVEDIKEAELEKVIWDTMIGTSEPVLELKTDTYETADGPWKAVLSPDLSTDRPLQYQAEGHFISFAPVVTEPSFSVESSLTDSKELAYDDAFGTGISIKMEVNQSHWKKLIVIESLEALGDISKQSIVEFTFEVETDFKIETDKHYTARLGENSYIETAQAWDSTPQEFIEVPSAIKGGEPEIVDTENKISIESGFREAEGKTYYYKRIPTEWLKAAIYPVRTDTDISWDTATEFESGDTVSSEAIPFISCCAIGDNKFAIAYYDDDDGDAGKAIVGTVVGTTITLGTASEFCSDIGIGGSTSVCKLGLDKFVVVYADDAQADDGYARVGTVVTRTISWGTAKEFETGDIEQPQCCQLGTDKFAILYSDEANSDSWTVCACTVSTSTITSGTPLTVYNSDANNSVKKCGIYKIGTDKLACVYSDEAEDGEAVVVTVSGTTCTLHTAVEFEATQCYACVCTALEDDKFAIVWKQYGKLQAMVCTVSTNTITKGTIAEYDSGYDAYDYTSLGIATIDSTHFISVFTANNDSDNGKSLLCAVDGTDISFGTAEAFNAANTRIPTICVLTDPAVAICAYCDYADATDHGEVIAGTLPVASADADIENTPSSKALGLLAESSTYYADGSIPSNPVVDDNCTFTITNNSGAAADVSINATDWTGGDGWTLTSNSPGSGTVRMTAYYSGQNPANGVVLNTTQQSFISSLADSGTIKWDFKLETGIFTDGVLKETTITLVASLS